jgi:hypothetical protein
MVHAAIDPYSAHIEMLELISGMESNQAKFAATFSH